MGRTVQADAVVKWTSDKRQSLSKLLDIFAACWNANHISGLTLRLQIGVGTAECAVLLPWFD